MWQHLERLGGGVGHRAARASRSSRPTAASRAAASRSSASGCARSEPPARRPPQGAAAHRDADGRARRLHERRQVDAPQRAHRRRRLGARPPLRDARPDDARLRARRPPLPRHRHRRLRPPPAAPARRGLRGDARGDARRRSRPPRRRRLGVRASGSSSRSPPSTPCCTRSARTSCRVELVLNKIDAVDTLAPAPAREPLPGRAAGLRAHRRGPRRAARADRRALRRALRARAAAPARTRRAGRLNELYALGAPIERAGGHAGGRPRRRAPAAARAAPLRAVPRRRGRTETPPDGRVIELPDPAPARRTRSCPTRAYAGDAGLDLAACERVELGPGSGRSSAPASRSRSPTATPASSSRARGSRRGTGSRS